MKNLIQEFINSYKRNPNPHYNKLDYVQFGKGLRDGEVDTLFGKIMSTPKKTGIEVTEEQKAELEKSLSESQAKQWERWKEKQRGTVGSDKLSLKADDVKQLQKDLPEVYDTFAHTLYAMVQTEAKAQDVAAAQEQQGGFTDRLGSARKLSMGGRHA